MTFSIFFFQAEDGIRDSSVTGVQTCALPISPCATKSASGRETDGDQEVARPDADFVAQGVQRQRALNANACTGLPALQIWRRLASSRNRRQRRGPGARRCRGRGLFLVRPTHFCFPFIYSLPTAARTTSP